MYKANVNCSVLKEYIHELMAANLVAERNLGRSRVVYTLTSEGREAVKGFALLKGMMRPKDQRKIPIYA